MNVLKSLVAIILVGVLSAGCDGSSSGGELEEYTTLSEDLSTIEIDGWISATGREDGETRVEVQLGEEGVTFSIVKLSKGDRLVASVDGGEKVALSLDDSTFGEYAVTFPGSTAGRSVTVELERESFANASATMTLPAPFTLDAPTGDTAELVDGHLLVEWSGEPSEEMRVLFQMFCSAEDLPNIFRRLELEDAEGQASIDFSDYQPPCDAGMTLERYIKGDVVGDWGVRAEGRQEQTATFVLR